MTQRRRATVAALGLAGVLGLTACGGTLDTGELEDQTSQAIADDIGVQVDSVDCPDDIEAKAGSRFTCTATAADGTTASVEVVQTDDEGNVQISAELVNIPSIESELVQQIGGAATVDCPDSLIVASKGTTFTCDATDEDGTTGKIEVTFQNDQGRFTADVISAEGGS